MCIYYIYTLTPIPLLVGQGESEFILTIVGPEKICCAVDNNSV